MSKADPIGIVLACYDRHARHAAATMVSVAKNSKALFGKNKL